MNFKDYNKQFQKKSKKTKFLILAVIMVIAVAATTVFLGQTSEDNQGYRTISVVEVSGKVSVAKDGIEYSAYPGMLLQEGHEIITSGGSYVRLVLDEDKYVKLEAGSKLVFETLGFMGSGKTRMNLERGSMTSELVNPLGEDEEYVVNTPNAVLAVRGTFFRVDLGISETGEVRADVMTYGGSVASQRVKPSGEVVEEEVLIDAGHKATINMTQEDTNYVVQTEDGETIIVEPTVSENAPEGEAVMLPTMAITTADIPDEDLVDVYFAAENGHELFVTAEEAKADIDVREINVEERTSVYEKAEEVKIEQQIEEAKNAGVSNTTSASAIANDSKSIVMVPETKEETSSGNANNATNTTAGSSNTSGTSSSNTNLVTDGDAHVHEKSIKRTEPTCTTAGKEIIYCRTCNKNLSITDLPALGHDYAATYTVDVAVTCTTNGARSRHCSRCESTTGNSVITATGHSFGEWVNTPATCTTDGQNVRTCASCQRVEREILPAMGHTEVHGGTEAIHRKCSICNAVLDTSHLYSIVITKDASCIEAGNKHFACVCGHEKDESIPAFGHNYVATKDEPTSTANGRTYDECSHCGNEINISVIVAINEVNFPDAKFREYVETNFNTDGEAGLTEAEIANIKSISVAGEGSYGYVNVDGGITDLTGIEYFSELTSLDAGYNAGITKVDVSNNSKLTTLKLACTGINQLDLSTCSKLETLDIGGIHLTMLANTATDGALVVPSVATIKDLNMSYTTFDYSTTSSNTLAWLGAVDTLNLYSAGIMDESWGKIASHLPDTLTSLDLSDNYNMTNLDLSEFTSLETLKLEGYMMLLTLDISNTKVSSINFCSMYDIQKVNVSNTPIVSVDLGYMWSLTEVLANDCDKLTQLSVNNCSSLATLEVTGAPITSLDLSNCSALTKLDVKDCVVLESFTLSGASNLTALDLSGCESITRLNVSNCPVLVSLNMEDSTRLQELSLNGLGISDIDLTEKDAITSLSVVSCPSITSLDVTNCSQLTSLTVTSCEKLTEIDASTCAKIPTLNVASNASLSKLDISGCSALTTLDASGTGLTAISKGTETDGLILPINAAITEMNLSNTNIDFSAASEEALACFGQLQTLTMKNANITDASWAKIEPQLSTNLTSLNLAENTLFTEVDLSACTELVTLNLYNCRGVLRLDISNTKVTNIDWFYINSLQEVNLENTLFTSLNLSNRAITTLYIKNMPNLTNLSIGTECSSLQYLYVENMPVLTRISLGNLYDITEVHIKNNPSLAEISASFTEGTNMALDELYLENLPALTNLSLDKARGLLTLDVSECPNLETLKVPYCNNLVTLTGYENNENITYVALSDTLLTEFDNASLPNLEIFAVGGTQIKDVDVTANSKLTELYVNGNGITETVNASGLVNLEYFNGCYTDSLKEINLSGCTSLTSMYVNNSPYLETLNISGTALADLNVSACTSLQSINLDGCTQITELDFSRYTNLTSLTYLNIANNGNLQSVNFSTLTALEQVDLAMSGSMTYINISNTKLTSFDSSGMPYVETYICQNATNLSGIVLAGTDRLTTLDVTGCSSTLTINLNHNSSVYADYENAIIGYENSMTVQ